MAVVPNVELPGSRSPSPSIPSPPSCEPLQWARWPTPSRSRHRSSLSAAGPSLGFSSSTASSSPVRSHHVKACDDRHSATPRLERPPQPRAQLPQRGHCAVSWRMHHQHQCSCTDVAPGIRCGDVAAVHSALRQHAAPHRLAIDAAASLVADGFVFDTQLTTAHQLVASHEDVAAIFERTVLFVCAHLAAVSCCALTQLRGLLVGVVGCYVVRVQASVFHVGLITPHPNLAYSSTDVTSIGELLASWAAAAFAGHPSGRKAPQPQTIELPLCAALRRGLSMKVSWATSSERVVPLLPIPPIKATIVAAEPYLCAFCGDKSEALPLFTHVRVRPFRPALESLLGTSVAAITFDNSCLMSELPPAQHPVGRSDAAAFQAALVRFVDLKVPHEGEYVLLVEAPLANSSFASFVAPMQQLLGPFLAVSPHYLTRAASG